MTPREATIQNLKNLKGQPLKEQLQYIFTSFRSTILVILAVLAIATSLIVNWAMQKDPALQLCCVDTVTDETVMNGYLQGFAQTQGIDSEKTPLQTKLMQFGQDVESDYNQYLALIAMQSEGLLDVLVADYEVALDFGYQGFLSDLTKTLTPQQLDALAPYLIYIDLALLEELDSFAGETPVFPDSAAPEKMEKPIPVAIKLQPEWSLTQTCYPTTYQNYALALFYNAGNMDNAQAFLQYILANTSAPKN